MSDLVELPVPELEARLRTAYDRVQQRVGRCLAEHRDFSMFEAEANACDAAEMAGLRSAIERAERRSEEETMTRSEQIQYAIDAHHRGNLSPLFPSAENLARLEEARARFATLSVIEERAALKTTDMGTAVEYGPSGLLAPRTLWRSSGVPTTEPPAGYGGVVPQFTLPAAAALVAEGNAHAEFDGVSPDTVQLGRAGAWSDLTAEGLVSTSLTEITAAHARIVARNIDLATVGKVEQSPSAVDIDEALVQVAAECACDVSALWIVGDPTAISGLVGVASAMTPTNAADVGSYAVRYSGAALYPTATASAGALTVFHPQSFRAFSTPLVGGGD